MTVEQIAIRQEVRQMLSEAGINKNTLKDIVREALQEEIQKAIKQVLKQNNINDIVHRKLDDGVDSVIIRLMREEIRDKVSNRFGRMDINVKIIE